jgi:hypothetical protein
MMNIMSKLSKDSGKKMKKTTLRIPEKLWLEARIHSLETGTDLQDMVAEGLRLYLKKKKKK